jgi:dimethylamine/trimethylamine dehydrogenase
MPNAQVYRGSRVTVDQVLSFGATRVVLATGASWRRDGIGRSNTRPIRGFDRAGGIFTPEDVMNGVRLGGPVIVFDDDHYYLGAILAEKLRAAGLKVALVTPAERVSAWTVNTLEQHAIQQRLMTLDVDIATNRNLIEFSGEHAVLQCVYSGRESTWPAVSVVSVTARLPNDDLATALADADTAVGESGILSVTSIGDCLAPGTIAAAVYAGHRYAREFDWPETDGAGFRREFPNLTSGDNL